MEIDSVERRGTVRRYALVLLVAAVGGQLGCSTFTSFVLLHPTSHPIETPAERATIRGTEGRVADQTLELFSVRLGEPSGEPDLFVLAITGNAGRAERMHRLTRDLLGPRFVGGAEDGPRSVELVSLQHPGFGVGAEGEASLEALADAAVDAVRELDRRAGERPLFVHALSMGSIGALWAARVLEPGTVDGLILEKPPELASLIVGEHGWWNAWLIAWPLVWRLPDCARSADNAAAIAGLPALFVVADADRVVPPEYSLAVAEAYAGPKRVLRFPGDHHHTVRPDNTPGLDEGLDWLWERAAGR